MRKVRILIVAAALLAAVLPVSAQQAAIRYSYLNNGFAYTSAEREYVDCSQPFWVRLERIGFPGGSVAYKLELDFVAPKSINIPKNVKFSAQTNDGKIIRATQMAAERTGKRAFTDASGATFYWNRGQYLLEEADVQKLAGGTKIMEVAYNWSPDGFWQIEFRKNEFGQVLKRQLAALKQAPVPTEEIGDRIADYGDRTGSLTIVAKPDVTGDATFQLRYIYYKKTNLEDFELGIQLATGRSDVILLESPVVFSFKDGTSMQLLQQQEANNKVIVYPEPAELRRLMNNVKSVTYTTEDGVKHTVPLADFSGPLARQCSALLMVAPI